MKTNPKECIKWSKKHFSTATILFCLLNTHFLSIDLLAKSAKASTGGQSQAAASTNTESTSDIQDRLVDFQFGGSLCPVCLNAFRIRLLNMPGVKTVEISVDKINPKSGHPPKLAHAFVSYDPDQISKESLIETIKRNDFEFLAAREKVSTNP